jgi:hypothetical protein
MSFSISQNPSQIVSTSLQGVYLLYTSIFHTPGNFKRLSITILSYKPKNVDLIETYHSGDDEDTEEFLADLE